MKFKRTLTAILLLATTAASAHAQEGPIMSLAYNHMLRTRTSAPGGSLHFDVPSRWQHVYWSGTIALTGNSAAVENDGTATQFKVSQLFAGAGIGLRHQALERVYVHAHAMVGYLSFEGSTTSEIRLYGETYRFQTQLSGGMIRPRVGAGIGIRLGTKNTFRIGMDYDNTTHLLAGFSTQF